MAIVLIALTTGVTSSASVRDWRLIWPLLLFIVVLCGILVPAIVWYYWRLARVKIDADRKLIAGVYVLRLVGTELAMLPAFLGASSDMSLPPPSGYQTLEKVGLVVILVGISLLFLSIWLEEQAKRQNRWRLRQYDRPH